MAKYSIGDNVFCTNEKWLHEKCSIMRVNKGSLLAKGVVYEVCSLATGDVINSWRKTHRLAYGMKAIYIFT